MYPKDIDPQSGCRLPLPQRDPSDPEAQRHYDLLAQPDGPTIRGLRGPGGIQLHSNELRRRTWPVSQYLRYEAGFSGRVRETAILITARECDSQFEWAAHEPVARREGVPEDAIEAIKWRRPLDGLDPIDGLVIRLGREIFGARKLSSQTYAAAIEHFGTRLLVDLVALMGNYAATAAQLVAFDMQLDPGQEPLLPA